MPADSPSAGCSDLVALGRALRRLRELRGSIPQEAVGYDAGLGKGYMSAVELGRLNPTFVTLLGIVRTLDFSMVELMDGYERRLHSIDPRAGRDVALAPTPEALAHVRNINARWTEIQQAAFARKLLRRRVG